MEAEELMIGDWVKFPIGNDKVVDLPYIEGRGVCASFAASATLFPVEVYKLEPIPLTPEILEKNGIEKDGPAPQGLQVWATRVGGRRFKIFEWVASGTFVVFDTEIRYVHELQHALRLCGIEKEIVI